MKKIFLLLAFLALMFSVQAQKIFYTDVHIYGKTAIGNLPAGYTNTLGLHVMGDDSIFAGGLFQYAHETSFGGTFGFYKSRGTLGVPLACTDGDTIYDIDWNYYTGSAFRKTAYIGSRYVTTLVNPTGEFYVYTRSAAGLLNRYLIDGSGNTQVLNGYLGVGGSPSFGLHLMGESLTASTLGVQLSSNDTRPPRLGLAKTRGTIASLLPVNSGDTLGKLSYYGTTSTTIASLFGGVNLVAIAKENFSSSNHGSEFYIQTADTTDDVLEKRILLDQLGNTQIQNGQLWVLDKTLGTSDSVLVREGNIIKYRISNDFDSTAFLNACHSLFRVTTIQACSPLNITATQVHFSHSLDAVDSVSAKNVFVTDTVSTEGIYFEDATYQTSRAWSLKGDAGTVDGTNFIGTTDNIPFSIRVNNVQSGRIDNTLLNTFMGYEAGLSNTGGGRGNNYFGGDAGLNNQTGDFNTAIGHNALYGRATFNTTGSISVGANSGRFSLGNYNTYVGYNAGQSVNADNSLNTYNIGIGYNSLVSITTSAATLNTSVGVNSSYSNTTGAYNTSFGGSSLFSVATTVNNIGLGYFSGKYTNLDRRLYVNSLDRTSVAGDTTMSIIYGRQHATASTQSLYLNSQVYLPYLTNVGSATDSVLVIDGATNRLEFVAQGSIFDSAAFLAACHTLFRVSDLQACSPLRISSDEKITLRSHGVLDSTVTLHDTAKFYTKSQGVLNSAEFLVDTNRVRINNVYNLPLVDGTADQFLQTDGAGVTSWGTVVVELDTLYGHIQVSRPNALDTLITATAVDLVANTTLFPKGSYFHFYKGSYTSTVNLARDSCVLYFDEGAIVTKTTAGAIFDYSTTATYTNDINILGYGSFYHTTNVGEVFTAYANNSAAISKFIFEFNHVSATNDDAIIYYFSGANPVITIKGRKLISSGGYALYYLLGGNTTLYIDEIISTSTNAVQVYQTGFKFTINSNYVYSSTNYGVYVTGTNTGGIKALFNIAYTGGNIGGYYLDCQSVSNSEVSDYVINGNASLVYVRSEARGGRVFHNGLCNQLTITSGEYTGNGVVKAVISGGSTNITMAQQSYEYNLYKRLTISGGVNNITFPSYTYWLIGASISGGTNNIYGASSGIKTTYSSGNIFEISDGNTTLHNLQTMTGVFVDEDWIYLSGGILQIKNGGLVNNIATPYPLITKTGGTLILDDVLLFNATSYQQFINAPTSAQDIKIYSGGCNTNGAVGSLLSAKARKDSLIVTAVAVTTIILNDGSGGAETFTETDVATYNTTALMAARMAALINASVTLDITATYIAGATFNIESDVAGTDYTESGLVNLTNTQLVLNSFLITETVGGALIESPNVTY